jgi:peptidoglycan/xylan/chitin deacetylase (PgdA/CDA1 family)
VAINLVVNYEEGGEYSLADDGVNDSWGEYSFQYGPEIRDLGTEPTWSTAAGSGYGGSAASSTATRSAARSTPARWRWSAIPPLCGWLRDRDHDVLGHGYHWYGPDAGPGSAMTRDQERAEIAAAVESIQRTTGQRIRGWMVRSFPTVHTRELLVEDGGFRYDSDANNDELPYFVTALGRPFLVVPLHQGAQRRPLPDPPHLRLPTGTSPRA